MFGVDVQEAHRKMCFNGFTEQTDRVVVCNILNLWGHHFWSKNNCAGHLVGGNLSPISRAPTQTDYNHSQTAKGLQMTVYLKMQISSILQSISINHQSALISAIRLWRVSQQQGAGLFCYSEYIQESRFAEHLCHFAAKSPTCSNVFTMEFGLDSDCKALM